MAAGLNRVSIIGNLGKDPELRQTTSGTNVCTLRLGVTERRKEGEEYKDHTEWVSVVCFGKTAENAGKFLQKGRQVFVEGRLQTRSWEDKASGQTRYTTEVIAAQLIFLGSNAASGGSRDSFSRPSDNGNGFSNNRNANNGADEMDSGGFIDEDEIPF